MSLITALTAEAVNSPSGTKTATGGPSYTRLFDIYCDSANDGPKTILDHPSTPQVGDLYGFGNEFDALIPLDSISCDREGWGNHETYGKVYKWILRCDYKYPSNTGQPPAQIENPLQRPVEVSGVPFITSKFTNKDVNGTVIKNSAKEAFVDPFEIPHTEFEIEFIRNEAISPANTALYYTNKINSQAIWGGDEHTWLCTGITFQLVYEGTYTYYRVTYRFRYNPAKHVLKVIDNGFNQLVGGVLKPILLADGTRPVEPFKLDGSGAKLSDNADPVFLDDIDIYDETPFSALSLPNF